MHELAVTEGILNIAAAEAKKHGASRILSIRLKIGEFSGVVPQLIQEYFDIVSRDSIADGAKLVVERVPATVKCARCGAENRMEGFKHLCPSCGSDDITMLTGREFFIDSLEAE